MTYALSLSVWCLVAQAALLLEPASSEGGPDEPKAAMAAVDGLVAVDDDMEKRSAPGNMAGWPDEYAKRGWNDLQGVWGKRGWKDLQGVWGKREGNWNNLKGLWGKREGGNWNNLKGLWGKRDGNWNNLKGLWGKRDANWNNLKGLWGKRDNWNNLKGLWGKKSVDSDEMPSMDSDVYGYEVDK